MLWTQKCCLKPEPVPPTSWITNYLPEISDNSRANTARLLLRRCILFTILARQTVQLNINCTIFFSFSFLTESCSTTQIKHQMCLSMSRPVHTGCNKMHDNYILMKDDDLYINFRPEMRGNKENSGATAYMMRINIL